MILVSICGRNQFKNPFLASRFVSVPSDCIFLVGAYVRLEGDTSPRSAEA